MKKKRILSNRCLSLAIAGIMAFTGFGICDGAFASEIDPEDYVEINGDAPVAKQADDPDAEEKSLNEEPSEKELAEIRAQQGLSALAVERAEDNMLFKDGDVVFADMSIRTKKGEPMEIYHTANQSLYGYDTVQGSCADATHLYYVLYNRKVEN